MFSNFWMTEVLKELVTTVGNEPVLINTLLSLWNHLNKKKCGASRGTILKNQRNLWITPAQAIGHKTPSLETFFLNSSKIRQRKNNEFWKKLIVGNLVCIKTCYSFKPAKKPFSSTKHKSQDYDIPKLSLIDALGQADRKITYFPRTLLSHNPLFGQNDINNFGPKGQPFKTILTWEEMLQLGRPSMA